MAYKKNQLKRWLVLVCHSRDSGNPGVINQKPTDLYLLPFNQFLLDIAQNSLYDAYHEECKGIVKTDKYGTSPLYS